MTVLLLIGLQILSRGGTFILNQALVRLAGPSAFGAAAIQFELVLSTILFLSREGVRTALLRPSIAHTSSTASTEANTNSYADRKTSTNTNTNAAFLPIVLGVPLSLATTLLYLRIAGDEVRSQPHFTAAVVMYALAAVLELVSEPMYNTAMTTQRTPIRVRAEGLGIAAKSVSTFLVLFYDVRYSARGKHQPELALVAFAAGQLMYSVTMFSSYVVSLGLDAMRPVLPTKDKSTKNANRGGWTAYVGKETLTLAGTMTLQSVVKHILTEGDKLVLAAFSPLSDQGGYAVAVNYGSLIARVIFQPIEESLRLFFTRVLLPSPSSSSSSMPSEKTTSKTPIRAALSLSLSTLHTLLSLQFSFSLLLLVFGTAYAPVILPLLLPPAYRATSALSVLEAWVRYVPFLAVNGGLEAFVASVAGPGDVNQQSRYMVLFTMLYISTAILLRRLAGLGDAALVYANIASLAVRIAYSLRFVASYYRSASASVDVSGSDRTKPKAKWVPSSPHPPPVSEPDKLKRDLTFRPSQTLPALPFLLTLGASALLIYTSHIRTVALQLVASFSSSAGPSDRGNTSGTMLTRKALMTHPAVMRYVGMGGVLGVGCVGVWWWCMGRELVKRFRRGGHEDEDVRRDKAE